MKSGRDEIWYWYITVYQSGKAFCGFEIFLSRISIWQVAADKTEKAAHCIFLARKLASEGWENLQILFARRFSTNVPDLVSIL